MTTPRLWDPPFKAAPPSEKGGTPSERTTPLADGAPPLAPGAPLPPQVAPPFTQLHGRATHPTGEGGERR